MVTGSQTLVWVEPQLDVAKVAESMMSRCRERDFEVVRWWARMVLGSLTAVRFRLRWVSLALLSTMVACAPRAGENVGAPSDAEPPALEAPVTLRLKYERGALRRIYLPVRREGKDALMMLDTGSAHSWLHADIASSDAVGPPETVELGGAPIVVRTRKHVREKPFEGLDVIGTVGTDYLVGAATEIDLVHGVLGRWRPGSVGRGGPWLSTPIEIVSGIPLVRMRVDDRAMRLMFDTGTEDLLLLDPNVDMESGPHVESKDVFGAPMTLVWGHAKATFSGAPTLEVPVWRTRSHPAFEKHVKELGGDIQGMVGLTTLGRRSVILDFVQSELRLGSIVD